MSTMNSLRTHLLDTLADLRNREKPMEVDRARAVAQVANVLVETAKVEVEYIRTMGGKVQSVFLGQLTHVPIDTPPGGTLETASGRVHLLG